MAEGGQRHGEGQGNGCTGSRACEAVISRAKRKGEALASKMTDKVTGRARKRRKRAKVVAAVVGAAAAATAAGIIARKRKR